MTTQRPTALLIKQTATGWRDLVMPGISFRGGAIAPDLVTFVGGIYQYAFDAAIVEELYSIGHPNHDYKPGTQVDVHIHWAPSNTNTGVVRWGVEYSFARGFSIEAFPATTTQYLEQAGSGTDRMHQIVDSGLITIANFETDGLIAVRVFRDATHVNDTYNADAFFLGCDFHFQSDRECTSNRLRGGGWDP